MSLENAAESKVTSKGDGESEAWLSNTETGEHEQEILVKVAREWVGMSISSTEAAK